MPTIDTDYLDSSHSWNDGLEFVREAMQQIARSHLKAKLSEDKRVLLNDEVLETLRQDYLQAAQEIRPVFAMFQHDPTIQGLLDDLLEVGGKCHITRIRYYHYSETDLDGELVIVDSAGYDSETASQLRIGPLVRFRSSRPLTSADSFWCFALGVPTFFEIQEHASDRLAPVLYPGCFPLIRTPVDQCEKHLAGTKARQWLDIPLQYSGRTCGKLSCDFDAPTTKMVDLRNDLIHFWCQAQQVTPYLDALYQNQFTDPLAEVFSDLQDCRSINELFNYCTSKLPHLFDCAHASIFTLSKDTFGAARLVLRKTSYVPSSNYENTCCYDVSDDSLTAWVARNNMALRLHNLEDDQDREQQLSAYRTFDGRLHWRNRLVDSSDHSSYLAVPITIDVKTVGGVLRFTEKNEGKIKYFSEKDQVFLQRIAKEAIGPRLQFLLACEQKTTLSFDVLQEANALLVEETSPKLKDIGKAVRSMLETFFPEMNGRQKLYLLNVLEVDGSTFRHHEIGGSLKNDMVEDCLYPLEGSLTGYVLGAFKENKTNEAVFINDFSNAKARGAMIVVCNSAVTALACPVIFRGKRYGVIVVKSSHHDLFLEIHGRLLEVVAAEAAAMFARRDYELLRKLDIRMESCTDHTKSKLSPWMTKARELFHSSENPSIEELDLQEVVGLAIREAGAKDACLEVPNMKVKTCRQTLSSIVYAILRDMCIRQQEKGEVIFIKASVEDNWLRLEIGQNGNFKPLLRASFDAADTAEKLVDNAGAVKDDDGITISRMLAYYHQFSHSRRGSVSFNRSGDAKSELVIKLPLG
ncbi:GAF domain-containing protein [Gimesia algae]|uniref:GAF domain-containing protein n=1 Tax=Gimesia algae TaxID=2527971 RepID=A0A517V6G8_9PLAN|nr:hypothetical protein [Gimesia algae]QDT88599.1 hypothetical protein Pan161_02170 [Gimesia algae]